MVMLFSITLLTAQEFSMDMVKNMAPRNIGPSGMSGRVTAIDVVHDNTDMMYVGTASGGTHNCDCPQNPIHVNY